MELKEFVKNVLVEIDDAVSEASSEAKCDISFSGEKSGKRTVEFDIAVTVENEDGKSGGGGIKIFSAGVGGEVSSINKNSTVSRVSFGVNISGLTKVEDARINADIESQFDSEPISNL